MRLLLASFINTVPASHSAEGFVTGTLPPLCITPNGAEIDYSLLLFAEQLVFDQESFEYLLAHRNTALETIGDSIEALRKEGLVHIANFRSLVGEYDDRIDRAAQLATNNLEYWLPGVRQHIHKYKTVLPGLVRLFSNKMSAWDEHIFSIANYYAKRNRPVSPKGAKRLANMILRKELEQMSSAEIDAVKAVVAETIRGVGAQALVAELTQSRHYTWNTCDHIFDMLANFRPDARNPIEAHAQSCRDFFRLAYPEFAPKTQTEWLRLLLHKDVTALRRKIAEASEAGTSIDAEFARKEYVRLVAALGETSRTKTLVGRGIDGAGVAAGALTGLAAGGLSLLASIVVGSIVSGAGIAAKESADSLINSKTSREFRWMYFMSDRYVK